jgi:photosystem II stability/assembly factor-like uncharacterized protein
MTLSKSWLKMSAMGLSLAMLATPITTTTALAVDIDNSYFDALKYRNIGPLRGGRSTVATGVIGDDQTYYFGATGGGVWKTTDAGKNWKNITDKYLKVGTVGAIAVSDSDPNVVYVGTGESPVRGVATAQGDGFYKSTDAGKTWAKIGFKMRGQVSMLKVHPTNPDIVWASVQGSPYKPTEERGVYKSTDGGETWIRTLFVDATTSAIDIELDTNNPRILYAAMWDNNRSPYKIRSGGAGSGLYKSTDGGDTWTELTKGLPKLMGKMGIAPSPANSDVVYAIVEASGKEGGLYRSNDGGESWTHVNGDRRLHSRSWYYMHITADPTDENAVYIMNAGMFRSDDGGKSLVGIRGTHGDFHGLWVNPNNTKNMISANDGGGAVTVDGGLVWSTQHNQPTAQFYRVNADQGFPYRIYGGQQDNSSVSVNSRMTDDYYSAPGCESAYIGFDPHAANPDITYGGCYLGQIESQNTKTGQTRDIRVYPEVSFGVAPILRKYRFNWNAPIVVSAHKPGVVYHGGNVLFRSTTEGQSWDVVSPDLSYADPATLGIMGGPITNEVTELYGTLVNLEESAHVYGTLFAGTDDGRLQMTQDDGATWKDITPNKKGVKGMMINTIESSPHNPNKIYAAVTGYKNNDYRPFIYRSTNLGKSWTKITKGIPNDDPVRVIREDTTREGLLYAGTETSMYISFDDGKNWQRFQQNLPHTVITDLKVHGDDLVMSTQGRAFWVLDNLTPLRTMNEDLVKETLHLFKPVPGFNMLGDPRQRRFGGGASPISQYENGAWLHYSLNKDLDDDDTLTMDIVDTNGNTVNNFSSKGKDNKLDGKKGLNKFVWNLQGKGFPGVKGVFNMAARRGGIMAGYAAAPGMYTVKMSLNDDIVAEQPLEVTTDPRAKRDPAGEREHATMVAESQAVIKEVIGSVNALRDVKAQAKMVLDHKDDVAMDDDLIKAAEALIQAAKDWEASILNDKRQYFQDALNFEDRLYTDLQTIYASILGGFPRITQGIKDRYADLKVKWSDAQASRDAVVSGPLADFNAAYKAANLSGAILKDFK